MSAVGHRQRLRASAPGLPRIGRPAAAPALVLGLLGLIAVSAHVRTRALGGPFWIDEGLTVGIARHGFADIPGVLRQDGSPPLYYELLHGWMALAGSSETATHALSLIFALLTVPAGFWLASTAFGRRAGWACAALCALNPMLSAYAQETRMYALVGLLSLLAAGAFVHAFVLCHRRYAWLHAAALAALLLTHNWGLFYAVSAGAAWLVLLARGPDRRRLALDGAIAFGVPLLVLAPWIPTLLYQAAHTGAPWGSAPHVHSLLRAPRKVLGGSGGEAVLLVVVGTAVIALARARRRAELRAAAVLAALAGGTLLLAWASALHTSAWASRYLIVLAGPLLLLASLGIARSGVAGWVALAVVAIGWWQLPPFHSLSFKSNVRTLSARLAGRLQPRDLVVAGQPESAPVLRYYLGPGLRYATLLGPVADPGVMDWRDAMARIRAARTQTVTHLVARLPVGARVAYVRPVTRAGGWRSPWTRQVKRRARRLGRALSDERGLRLVAWLGPGRHGALSTLRAAVYERVPARGTPPAEGPKPVR